MVFLAASKVANGMHSANLSDRLTMSLSISIISGRVYLKVLPNYMKIGSRGREKVGGLLTLIRPLGYFGGIAGGGEIGGMVGGLDGGSVGGEGGMVGGLGGIVGGVGGSGGGVGVWGGGSIGGIGGGVGGGGDGLTTVIVIV